MEFPILYLKTENGKKRFWKIELEEKGGEYLIKREYGLLNGKKTKTNPIKMDDKKKAITRVSMMFRKKKEEGFYENGNRNKTKSSVIRPMGAHKLDDFEHKLIYPVLVQRKLDGYRCLSTYNKKDKKIILYTRTMKQYHHLDHIRDELKKIKMLVRGDIYLDGELYSHELGLHEIGSIVRKQHITNVNRENMKMIKYYLFDMFNPEHIGEETFEERYRILESIFRNNKFKYVELVKSVECEDLSCVEKENEKYLMEGYEGVIVRNKNGLYKWNKKSYDVLRTKEFKRGEFLIIGAKQGEGQQQGAIIWHCECGNDKKNSFWAIPEGTIEERRKMYDEYFREPKGYIGKIAIVKYLEKDKDGCVTRNPIVEKIKDI